MKTILLKVFIVTNLLLLVFLMSGRESTPSPPFRTRAVSAMPAAKTQDPVPAVALLPSPAKQSLAEMAGILFQFTQPGSQLKDLVYFLQNERQEPLVAHDNNPFTGEMAIVRTRKPLPGTRYFHAQYFSDEAGVGFVQHMSFEFKPGPTAMNEAISAVQDAFHLSSPESARDGYAKWKLDDQRILWIKRLEGDELRDDPFNAYGPGDNGTIRVAIEVEIHPGDAE